MCAILISKARKLARVNEGSQFYLPTHTFIHKWNESFLHLLRSRGASPHFGRYYFPS